MGIEPTASTLARWRSTAELRPLNNSPILYVTNLTCFASNFFLNMLNLSMTKFVQQ